MICRLLICLVCWIALSHSGFSHPHHDLDKKSSPPRVLTISDADDWQRVNQFVLSPNGQWSAHVMMPNEGDGKLIVARTDGKKRADTAKNSDDDGEAKDGKKTDAKDKAANRYEFEVGPNSGQIQFSHNSQFVAFME